MKWKYKEVNRMLKYGIGCIYCIMIMGQASLMGYIALDFKS